MVIGMLRTLAAFDLPLEGAVYGVVCVATMLYAAQNAPLKSGLPAAPGPVVAIPIAATPAALSSFVYPRNRPIACDELGTLRYQPCSQYQLQYRN